ncbi:hypothetical protein AAC387_Pa05g0350 [Persea americana]
MAAVGSCFTAACIRSKHISSSDNVFRLSCLRALPVVTTVAYTHHLDSLSISIASPKRRLSKIYSSVAQEEAAAAAIETQSDEVEKEEENVGEEEGSVQEEEMLAGIIQDYGSPEMVEVLYDRNTGRSRGFAFVTMSSIEDCNAVIENLDGSEYGGRTLRVNFSDKPKPKEPLYPETEYKLFVGNLSWSVTSEGLTEAFQEYGNVVGARVLYDGDTGRSRGYGFVCYSTQQEMDAAIENLNGVELEGRTMRVSVALGKRS